MAGKAKLVQRSRLHFLQEAQIWYDRNLEERTLSDQFENAIVLSEEFYREITSYPIPTDLEGVKVRAGAPIYSNVMRRVGDHHLSRLRSALI
jgi:hypothetical protein